MLKSVYLTLFFTFFLKKVIFCRYYFPFILEHKIAIFIKFLYIKLSHNS